MNTEFPPVIDHLRWLGHDSFRLAEPISIYIDPWRLPAQSPPADLILVSHDHHDHCSPADVERIRHRGTVVVANPSAAVKLKPPVRILRAGETHEISGVRVEAVPAYNLEKPFHPKDAGGLGWILQVEDARVYFAGDTDLIPEMEHVVCDVALLPVSGKYVMTAEEAAQAAEVLQPRVAIPMHYGAGVAGTIEDAERFRRLCSSPVLILEPDQP